MQDSQSDQPADSGETKPKKHLVQLEFSQAGHDELLRVKEHGKNPTVASTVRNALAVYKWYLEAMAAGDEVLVRHMDGSCEKITFVADPPDASPTATAEAQKTS